MCFCVSIVLHNFVQIFNCKSLYQLRFLHNLHKTISKEKCYLLIVYPFQQTKIFVVVLFSVFVYFHSFPRNYPCYTEQTFMHTLHLFSFFRFRSSDEMLLASLLLSVCHRVRSQKLYILNMWNFYILKTEYLRSNNKSWNFEKKS